jgi:NAD(P)-dependent dehydrogenase (short-subunit alcohol dehydrogenase family)
VKRGILQSKENLVTPNTRQSKGRIALITGGTDGLGRAAAVMLAERGYRVFAGGRNVERVAALQQFANERKLPLTAMELDVCDDASVERAVAEIEKSAGTVDVLVNNAGIAIAAVMEEITLTDLRRQFETNYFGLVRMSQRVLPGMRRKLSGRIVNMSSIAGKLVSPLFGPYSSSKHAVEAVSDAMRLEVYPFGIQVVLIEPGYIPTSMNRNAGELSSAYAKGAEQSPYKSVYQGFLKSWGKTSKSSHYTPEDCARVVVRAIEDDPPRARYPVTREAKIGILARRLLSDRAMDRQMRKAMSIPDPHRTPKTGAPK